MAASEQRTGEPGEHSTPPQFFEREDARRLSNIYALVGRMPARPRGEPWEGDVQTLVHLLAGGHFEDDWIIEQWKRVELTAPGEWATDLAAALEES